MEPEAGGKRYYELLKVTEEQRQAGVNESIKLTYGDLIGYIGIDVRISKAGTYQESSELMVTMKQDSLHLIKYFEDAFTELESVENVLIFAVDIFKALNKVGFVFAPIESKDTPGEVIA
jgi:hypothetical protein